MNRWLLAMLMLGIVAASAAWQAPPSVRAAILPQHRTFSYWSANVSDIQVVAALGVSDRNSDQVPDTLLVGRTSDNATKLVLLDGRDGSAIKEVLEEGNPKEAVAGNWFVAVLAQIDTYDYVVYVYSFDLEKVSRMYQSNKIVKNLRTITGEDIVWQYMWIGYYAGIRRCSPYGNILNDIVVEYCYLYTYTPVPPRYIVYFTWSDTAGNWITLYDLEQGTDIDYVKDPNALDILYKYRADAASNSTAVYVRTTSTDTVLGSIHIANNSINYIYQRYIDSPNVFAVIDDVNDNGYQDVLVEDEGKVIVVDGGTFDNVHILSSVGVSEIESITALTNFLNDTYHEVGILLQNETFMLLQIPPGSALEHIGWYCGRYYFAAAVGCSDGASRVMLANKTTAMCIWGGADYTTPYGNILRPQDGSALQPGDVEILASARDTESGVSHVVVCVEESGQSVELQRISDTLFYGILRLDQEGKYTLALQVFDRVGRRYTCWSRIIVDATPPVLEYVEPANNSVLGHGVFRLAWSWVDEDSGVANCYYAIDDSELYPVSTEGYCWLNVSEGKHRITLLAQDCAGNNASTCIYVIVDTSPPQCCILYPSSKAIVSASFTVTWVASDAISYIAYSEVSIDDGPWVRVSGFNYTVVGLSSGVHKICVRVTDAAGWQSTDLRLVTVDAEPPTVRITEPSNETTINATHVRVCWTATDDMSGCAFYEVFVNESLVANTTSLYAEVFFPNAGTYTITVVAHDYAGNTAQSMVIVQVIAPYPATEEGHQPSSTPTPSAETSESSTVEAPSAAASEGSLGQPTHQRKWVMFALLLLFVAPAIFFVFIKRKKLRAIVRRGSSKGEGR